MNFFAIVLYTNMAAVVSRENRENTFLYIQLSRVAQNIILVMFPRDSSGPSQCDFTFIHSRRRTARKKQTKKHFYPVAGYIALRNLSYNLSRNFVATQVARKIALCNTPCHRLSSQLFCRPNRCQK